MADPDENAAIEREAVSCADYISGHDRRVIREASARARQRWNAERALDRIGGFDRPYAMLRDVRRRRRRAIWWRRFWRSALDEALLTLRLVVALALTVVIWSWLFGGKR
jgi:hypothetical protein